MTEPQARTSNHRRAAFGRRVRVLRVAQGMSQERLAEAAGMHRTYLSGLERGLRNVGLDNIFALADALNVDPCNLFSARGL